MFSHPFEIHSNARALERHAHKIAHRLCAVGGQHKGVGFVGLQHAPHAFHIFLGKTPVALGIQVAQLHNSLLPEFDFGNAVCDFSGHKFATAQRAFMVEQNATAAKNTIALAVVDCHPVRIQLGHAIGAAGVKRSVFHLWNRLHLAKHFRGTGLVVTYLRVDDANCLQQVDRTNTGNLCRGDWLFKRHTHKALGCQIVNLGGLCGLQKTNA
ncbi:hypothetical protein D3C71_1174530 [compost metagenome]